MLLFVLLFLCLDFHSIHIQVVGHIVFFGCRTLDIEISELPTTSIGGVAGDPDICRREYLNCLRIELYDSRIGGVAEYLSVHISDDSRCWYYRNTRTIFREVVQGYWK